MELFIIMLIFLGLGAVEIISLIKDKKKKEIIAYIALFIPGITLLFLLILGVELPDIHQYIGLFVSAITGQ